MTAQTDERGLPVMKPAEIDDITLAFPAGVRELMPEYYSIPSEFKVWPAQTKFGKLVSDWFYFGITDLELLAKEGIDECKAIRHIMSIMRSFEPKHEHKEAACAYLMSLWFEDAEWKRKSL